MNLRNLQGERLLFTEEPEDHRLARPHRKAMVEHAVLRGSASVWLAGHREHQEGNLAMTIEELVEEFARNVAAQTDAIFRGDTSTGDEHAERYISAFKKLRSAGDAGRDALAGLLEHPRMDVRVGAAACLLRHRTAESKAVLEAAARGEGLAAFEAAQVLKNWENGTWALDPA